MDSMMREKSKGMQDTKIAGKAKEKKLKIKARKAMKMLISQLQDVEVLMKSLEESHLRIQRAERRSENSARAMYAAVEGRGLQDQVDDWSDASLGTSSSVFSSASQEPTPPQNTSLEQYFDAVGTLNNVHERWAELHVEKQEQEERRILMLDQEQTLEQSDGEFERSWQKHFDTGEKALHKAWEVVEAALDVCRKEQIEIPPWARVEFPNIGVANPVQEWQTSEKASVDSFETADACSRSSSKALVLTDVILGNVPTQHVDEPLRGERIASWVNDMETKGPDTRTRHAEDNERITDVGKSKSRSLSDLHLAPVRKVKSLSALGHPC